MTSQGFNPDDAYDAMWDDLRVRYDWPAAGQRADDLREWLAGGGRAPRQPYAREWIARICEITARDVPTAGSNRHV